MINFKAFVVVFLFAQALLPSRLIDANVWSIIYFESMAAVLALFSCMLIAVVERLERQKQLDAIVDA